MEMEEPEAASVSGSAWALETDRTASALDPSDPDSALLRHARLE